jgi:hypothetical protein
MTEKRQKARKNKKIDVYKNGQLISSVGALGYSDYPTYIKENGKFYADKRRKLYKIRHNKDSARSRKKQNIHFLRLFYMI